MNYVLYLKDFVKTKVHVFSHNANELS